MTLAPFDFLVAIIANGFVLPRRFDALRVNTAGRGLGLASLQAPLQLAQGFDQTRPDALFSPASGRGTMSP